MENINSEHAIRKDPKTAILLVTTGTTRDESKNIFDGCVNAFKTAYPDVVIRSAVASEIVRQAMAEKGIIAKSPLAALTDFMDEGFSKIIVQPLYITPGNGLHELYSIVSTMNSFSGKHGITGIEGILIGKPLLMDAKDYSLAAGALSSYFGLPEKDDAILLVSPVDENGADPSLCQLQLVMDEVTGGRFIVGSSSGYPDVDWVIKRLEHINARKVTLATLAMIPGKHAEYELAGDNPKSWKNMLESAGYEVLMSEKTLGKSTEIAEHFISSLGEVGSSHGFF
ncbi:sirohydrochlorin cobaltochelatase [Methanolobus psychrotolerans]|uniref:sirohydrochlorin cobaltochelatase n=1 Tax=Methanolobus psychrotolerans TaxID=1874706 RepID=UPI000B915925|nr:sirohydrochlorin cobaltochelatase [Methanolobus psychrotolerans]